MNPYPMVATVRKGLQKVWTVVYIAPNKREADKIRERLSEEGLLVKLRELGFSRCDHNSSVEILVPESEVHEALEIINTNYQYYIRIKERVDFRVRNI